MKIILTAAAFFVFTSVAYADDRAAMTRNLLKQGYTVQQVQEMNDAYDSFTENKSATFDKERLQREDAIVRDAAKSGDFTTALDRIEKLKKEGGYSDKWAMRLVGQVRWAMQQEQLAKAMR